MQYEWERDELGNILYNYEPAELARRRQYLRQIDQLATATLADLEDAIQDTSPRKIICWGAGFGKTTVIRQFICANWQQGILLAVFTVDEVKQLSYDIAAFIGQNLVFSLYTNERSDPYQTYLQHPDVLKNYPVLVTTHQRLVLDPPQLLYGLSHAFRPKSMEGAGRTYIFLDERPIFFEKLTFTADQLATIDLASAGSPQREMALQTFDELLMQSENARLSQAAQRAYMYLAGLHNVSKLGRARALNNLDTLNLVRSNETGIAHKDGSYTCYNHPGLLEFGNLLVLDGTGDLSLKGSAYWSILKPEKFQYHFVGSVQKLESLRMDRNIEKLKSLDQLEKWFEKLKATINELCIRHTKVLIVTWKRLQGSINLLQTSEDLPLETTGTVHPVESLPGFIWEQLPDLVEDERIEITYYQSGETRATSQFAECDAVLFLGMFHIPQAAIKEYNTVNQSTLSHDDYVQAEIVQAIYRSQIRRDKPVHVYFSGDFKRTFIDKVLQYIHAVDTDGKPLGILTFQETMEIKYVKELKALRKNFRPQFLKLLDYDPDFVWNEKTTISLGELYALIPRSQKRRKEYRSFVEALQQIELHLEITG